MIKDNKKIIQIKTQHRMKLPTANNIEIMKLNY